MLNTQIEFLKKLESIRTDFLNKFFELLTMLGEDTLLVIIITLIYYMYDKKLAKKIAFISVGSLCVNCITKNIVKLKRPFEAHDITCVRPETATGFSFPSGHTQNAASWTGAFAFIFRKPLITAGAVIITLCVAFSRLYLGAHYPTDVIAGAVSGFFMAYLLGYIHSKSSDENRLYAISGLIFTPFAFYFMFNPDERFDDFYKAYGMIWGLLCASALETKYVNFTYDTAIWKKIIRVIAGVIAAYSIKEAFEAQTDKIMVLQFKFAIESFRYLLLVFISFGICPAIFKKLNL